MQSCLQGYCLQERASPFPPLQRDVSEQNVRVRSFPPSTLAQAMLVHHFLFRLMLCGFETSAVAYSLVHCIIRYALTQFLSPASSQVSGCGGTASILKNVNVFIVNDMECRNIWANNISFTLWILLT